MNTHININFQNNITTQTTQTTIPLQQHKKACKNCTRLHHKCDKKMPCNYCTKRGITCEINPCLKKRGRPFGSTNKKTKRDILLPKKYKIDNSNVNVSHVNINSINSINSTMNSLTSNLNNNLNKTPSLHSVSQQISTVNINTINISTLNTYNAIHNIHSIHNNINSTMNSLTASNINSNFNSSIKGSFQTYKDDSIFHPSTITCKEKEMVEIKRVIKKSIGEIEIPTTETRAPPILVNWDFNVDIDNSILNSPIFINDAPNISFDNPLENNDLFNIF